jgi:DNA-binding response OmpR family regulator
LRTVEVMRKTAPCVIAPLVLVMLCLWRVRILGGVNVVDAVIKNLRKKLGKKSELIETIAGYGYKFRSPT